MVFTNDDVVDGGIIDIQLIKQMVDKFHKDEAGYEKWLLENTTSYVFNHFGTAEMNKMHQATCHTLHSPKHKGSRTNYEKICSLNYLELEQKANKVTRNEWSKCKACF